MLEGLVTGRFRGASRFVAQCACQHGEPATFAPLPPGGGLYVGLLSRALWMALKVEPVILHTRLGKLHTSESPVGLVITFPQGIVVAVCGLDLGRKTAQPDCV